MSFDVAVDVVLKHEGGYVNDPDDSGGVTNHGITQVTLSNFRGAIVTREDVKNLTVDEAKLIYKKMFWDHLKLDDIADQNLQTAILDQSVLSGVYLPVRYLQIILGVKADGVLGPDTANAINAHTMPSMLIVKFKQEMLGYYTKLAANNPSDQKFLRGWVDRVMSLPG